MPVAGKFEGLPEDLVAVAKVMGRSFDSIETGQGSFDFNSYPYNHAMDILRGNQNTMLCYGVSSFTAFLTNQLGYKIRLIQLLGNNYVNGTDQNDTHVVYEYYSEGLKKWVLVDPTFDAFWQCGEKRFLDYPELRECLQAGGEALPIFLRAESKGPKKFSSYPVPVKQIFYSGMAMDRNKNYGFLDWFLIKVGAKEPFPSMPFPVDYELPERGIYDKSVQFFVEKNKSQ